MLSIRKGTKKATKFQFFDVPYSSCGKKPRTPPTVSLNGNFWHLCIGQFRLCRESFSPEKNGTVYDI